MITQDSDSQAAMTPQSALDALLDGNRRFVEGKPARRDSKDQIARTSGGQWPFAAILSCIDSRVPAELVFDQGIGDMFSARVAGNVVNPDILGSLEFACKVAGAKLVLVLGHTSCGAVKGACDGVELGNLSGLLARVGPAIEAVTEPGEAEQRNSSNAGFVQDVAEHNVRVALRDLAEQSAVLGEMLAAGEIAVAGAMYDVATGEVKLLEG